MRWRYDYWFNATLVLVVLCSQLREVSSFRTLLQRNRASGSSSSCDMSNRTACGASQVCAPVFEADAICVSPPMGGAVVSTNEGTFPTPFAYFPLSEEPIRSWPQRNKTGTIEGAVLVADADFGHVFRCQKGVDLSNRIVLEPIEFSEEGPFAVNLWIRLPVGCRNEPFTESQYILSTSARSRRYRASSPNQIQITLPDEDRGTVHVTLRDTDDRNQSIIASNSEVDINDGQWHMITLTSLQGSRRIPNPSGFQLYVDGVKMEKEGTNGGGPLELDGKIHLCQRHDGEIDTQFDGFLTQISFFSVALTEKQVKNLYTTVSDLVLKRKRATRRQRRTNLKIVRGREVDSGLAGQSENEQLTNEDIPSMYNYTELIEDSMLCLTGRPVCGRKEICAPVHGCLINYIQNKPASETTARRNGVCIKPSSDGYIFNASRRGILTPLAYFPLKGGLVDSWPIASYRGYSIGTETEEDEIFGEVFSCEQKKKSLIVLENVPYGVQGSFAVNFWFKAKDLSGRAFQYLLSHGSANPSQNSWESNQLQVLFPEEDHVGYGVLRVVLKDSDDNETVAAFLDSDGETSVLLDKEGSSVEDQEIKPTDGEWHMVTITTLTEGESGFSMYLDGGLVGTYDTEKDELPPGGQPLRAGGKIYICGRNDAASNRYFEGNIAELAFFDTSLSRRHISSIYNAALATYPDLETIVN